jgi:prepilin-type N-terminal cleavage/methylation domain-containing protein
MCRSISNNRGFSLVEVMIALFITVVAVTSIFTLMTPAWRTATMSDQFGRAADILSDQMQQQELFIMNPCNNVVVGTTGPVTINASGYAAAQPGDVQFSLTRNIVLIAPDVWRVTVRVAWPGNAGISESLVVTRQEYYRYPGNCP